MRPLLSNISSLVLTLVIACTCLPTSAQTTRVVGDEILRDCVASLDELPTDSAVHTCIIRLRSMGYLEASLDSTSRRNDTSYYHTHLGPAYQLGTVTARANPDFSYGAVLPDTLVQPKNLASLSSDAEAFLDQQGRAGYPFARVRFDSLQIHEEQLNVRSTTWSGPRMTYGGVRFVDDAEPPVSQRYLERYLRVEPGTLYRSNEVNQIERRLRTLTFLQVDSDPVVVFESGEALFYIDASPRKTSRFDFLLGFLPNSAANDGQLLLTGDITLELENALRQGERLFFSFERLQPEATEVKILATYPYLLDSPFGARGTFGLYRQQDDWLRINYELGGSYALGGGDAYELYYEGGQAQVLGFDTVQVEATQRLPETLDAKRNGFGARLRLDRRDDIFDTRRGGRLTLEASAALRIVSVPSGIRALSDIIDRQADSIGGQTAQYRSAVDVEQFVATGRRATLALRLRGATIFGPQTPLRNELYRIGGNRLLRGFDEQTIDAQHYGVATAEYRLLLGNASYLFAFADQGILYDPYRSEDSSDQPTGFGAGLRLGTKGGALSLTYAYGRRSGAPIEWDRAKVHIGFESRF